MFEDRLYAKIIKMLDNDDLSLLSDAYYLDDVQILEIFKRLKKCSTATRKDATKILSFIKSDEIFMMMLSKYEYLFQNHNIFTRFLLIHDDELKMDYIEELESQNLRILLTLSLENMTLRDKILSKINEGVLTEFYSSSDNREVLLRLMPYIHDEKKKNELMTRAHWFSILTDTEVKRAKEINQLPTVELKIDEILKNCYSNNMINYLIKKTDNPNHKKILLKKFMNYDRNIRHRFWNNLDLVETIDKLPESLYFGIEIECFGDASRPMLLDKLTILEYDVKDEFTIPDGIEFTSKLSWNKDHIDSLYDICAYATQHNLKVDHRCGGHIHFDASYLNTKSAWYWFFYLYSKFESTLFAITNKEGELPRENVFIYSKPLSKKYVSTLNRLEKTSSIEEFKKEVNNLSKVRLALALSKHDTIEFRMPNASLNPKIILENVLLLGNIIVLAKKLSLLPLREELHTLIYKLDNEQSEDEKLNLLLRLLFKDGHLREVFQKRYNRNRDNTKIKILTEDTKSFNFQDRGITI